MQAQKKKKKKKEKSCWKNSVGHAASAEGNGGERGGDDNRGQDMIAEVAGAEVDGIKWERKV